MGRGETGPLVCGRKGEAKCCPTLASIEPGFPCVALPSIWAYLGTWYGLRRSAHCFQKLRSAYPHHPSMAVKPQREMMKPSSSSSSSSLSWRSPADERNEMSPLSCAFPQSRSAEIYCCEHLERDRFLHAVIPTCTIQQKEL